MYLCIFVYLFNFSSKFISRLRVFVKEIKFIPLKRSIIFNFAEYMSTCGGLLQIFIGASAISLWEIFYYMTLRFYCTFVLRRMRELKREEEMTEQKERHVHVPSNIRRHAKHLKRKGRKVRKMLE